MRRWLAILLLCVLPTQMSWAAVAAYCAHEPGAAVGHVGHHDHAAHGHAPALPDLADAAADSDFDTKTGTDLDCSHCHGHGAGMLASVAAPALDRLAAAPAPSDVAPRAAHTADQPERPQWAALA